jgi:hypothetical protein
MDTTRAKERGPTDLAALPAARSMRDDFERLFEPPFIGGRPNPRRLTRAAYLARAREAALEGGRHNGLALAPGDVSSSGADWAPMRVKVNVKRKLSSRRGKVPVDAAATAELSPPVRRPASTRGLRLRLYGRLAYRQGNARW